MPFFVFRDCNQCGHDEVFATQAEMDVHLQTHCRYVAEKPHPGLPVYLPSQNMETDQLYTLNRMGNTDCCYFYVIFTEKEAIDNDMQAIYKWFFII